MMMVAPLRVCQLYSALKGLPGAETVKTLLLFDLTYLTAVVVLSLHLPTAEMNIMYEK